MVRVERYGQTWEILAWNLGLSWVRGAFGTESLGLCPATSPDVMHAPPGELVASFSYRQGKSGCGCGGPGVSSGLSKKCSY